MKGCQHSEIGGIAKSTLTTKFSNEIQYEIYKLKYHDPGAKLRGGTEMIELKLFVCFPLQNIQKEHVLYRQI